jgi:hypothetical protein
MTKTSDERLWKGNEQSGSITCGEFLDWLRKYCLLKDSVPGRAYSVFHIILTTLLIISLNNINGLIFAMDMKYFLCEKGTELL